jgi:predicted CxxxxCH...CXXCH cytochrome family protein
MRIGLAFTLALAGLALEACKGTAKSVTPFALSTCTSCHGQGDGSAPPLSTTGARDTTDIAVGAHQTHVNPGPFRKALACSECHPVPLSSAQANEHRNGVADVVFGPLASNAGATPTWNPAQANCSTTYCHGGTLGQGPLSNNTPTWTKVDGTQVSCGTCHGIPPPPPKHPVVDASIPGYDPARPEMSCNACHPGTVRADGALDVDGGQHIDGVTEIGAFACARCHGDTSRALALSPAPPSPAHDAGHAGSTANDTSLRAVGAHLVHLTGTRLAKDPVACGECHAVPTSMLAHPNPAYASPLYSPAGGTNIVVDMTWGPLATAGGTVPSWNPGTPSCSATYCHGGTLSDGKATAPIWTKVDGTQVACDSCHGMPPDTVGHASMAKPSPASACADCHPHTVSAGGALDVAAGFHLNGSVEIGTATCTACHGDARKVDPRTGLAAAVALQSAPPADLSGDTDVGSRGVGAHDAHLYGKSLRATPIACAECHVSYVSTDHPALPGHSAPDYPLVRFGPLASAAGAHPTWNAPTPRSDGCPSGFCTCSTSYCHGATLTGGTATEPVWTRVNGAQVTCASCHGDPPPLPHEQRNDCSTCHAGYTSTTVNLALHIDGKVDATGGSCTSCHGDPARSPSLIAPAPPANAGTGGSPWAGSDPGAHLKHLTGTKLRRTSVACAECHLVPTASPGPPGSGDTHGDGVATVVFGSLSATDGARPTWSPAALTCSTTYCHGGTLQGGTETAPKWNETGGAASSCGACHGNPPPTTSQGGTHPDVAAAQNCNGCHTGYSGVKGGTITVNTTLHLNGVIDSSNGSGSCASCHGDPQRSPSDIASAPPANALGVGGATPPWAAGDPGAHLAHLTGTTLRSAAIACAECHTVPTTSDAAGGHRNGTANVVFGSLSKSGGASPTWTPGTLGCAATYCHGATMQGGSNTAPTWTGTSAQVACGTCHGLPPATPEHASVTASTNCNGCHGGYDGSASGTIAVNKAVHLNGLVEADTASLTCTSCHGTAGRTLVAGADPRTASAPPVNAGDASSPWASGDPGAHLAHLNPAPSGALAAPIACSECHVVPSLSSAPSGTHENGAADVTFGTLSKTLGSSPAFSPGTLGCAASYCHGGTMAGGTNTAPTWNGNAAQVACGTCHGIPPATVASGARPHPASSGSDCGSCHTGYTATTVNVALHVNGTIDASGGTCTSCHGDSNRVLVSGADAQAASAPPMVANSGTWPFGPGAHLAHVNRGTGALGKPVACAECHVVPASSGPTGTHENGVADLAFGTLSRTVITGSPPNPVYHPGNASTAPSCSTTYCHGAFTVNPNSRGANGGQGGTPSWNTAGPLACSACHTVNGSGVPVPTDTCHPPNFNHDGGNRCSDCHKNVNSTGTAITNAAIHVDGVVNGKCVDCHKGAAPGSSKNRNCQ